MPNRKPRKPTPRRIEHERAKLAGMGILSYVRRVRRIERVFTLVALEARETGREPKNVDTLAKRLLAARTVLRERLLEAKAGKVGGNA